MEIIFLDILKCPCDLENKVKVTKTESPFNVSMQVWSKIHALVQKIMHGKADEDADANGIHTKNNMSRQPSDIKKYIAWFAVYS